MSKQRFLWRHPDYVERKKQWERQRHAIEGEDKVKEMNVVYLPKLSGQSSGGALEDPYEIPTPNSYKDYLKRATFLNATGRTVDGLVGLVTRKSTDVEFSDDELLKSVGRDGSSFREVQQQVLTETVGVGRYGLLVDMPRNPSPDAKPYVAEYRAEDITDWDYQVNSDGALVVTYVVLREHFLLEHDGQRHNAERYRVCILGEEDASTESLSNGPPARVPTNPVYYQLVWEQARPQGDDMFAFVGTFPIRGKGGRTLDHIPFTFFNPKSTKPDPEKPPLMDLTVVNFSHYRNSADLEHGAHFTALPQPWTAGFEFPTDVYIGSGRAWTTPEPNAKAGYLEFSGKGLGFLKELMYSKEKNMAAMGARLLEEQQPAGNEEATSTVKLRMSGERSVLARCSLAVSDGLTRVLRDIEYLLGSQDSTVNSAYAALNTEYGVEGLSGDDLRAMSELVIKGQMSWATLIYNMRRAEIIPDDITDEDERGRIEAGSPAPPTPAAFASPTPFPSQQPPQPSAEEDDDDE